MDRSLGSGGLWFIQDVYGADINKHWTGSYIILASYWSIAREVPLSTVHTMYFAYLTSISLILLELIWTQIKELLCHFLSLFSVCLLPLHTHLEQSIVSASREIV
jgi:hypothetical protein